MAAPSAEELRREFLLDPEVAFLNHGSFGACPRPVFERYQAWQRELEREPVDFLDRRLPGAPRRTRAPALADYVGCPEHDLAFVQNATTGVNLAARSLDLRPGDEVLATDLEYGACDLAWEQVCAPRRRALRPGADPAPARDPSEVVDALFAGARERTRAVYVSHVTSDTGTRPAGGGDRRARPRARSRHRSSTAHTRLPRCRSTSPRSAPTSTRATATSGSARRKAPASSTSAPSTRNASTPPSSAGATATATTFSAAHREAGNARPGRVAHRPGRDPLPDRARLGRRPRRAAALALARRAATSATLLGTRAARAGVDGRADGDACRLPRPAPDLSGGCSRGTASRSRSTGPDRRPPAPLRRRLHDARRDRPAASRPRSGA